MAKNINIVFNDGFPGWNGETPNTPRPGWAIEEYLEELVHTAAVLALPPVTEENNGDFMTVVDGEWAPADVTLDEKIAADVDEWLEDHPEATTTVQDGAITNAKLASSFVTPGTAAAYSSSATYAVGDYVFHDGALYRCITAISTAEAWTEAHWTAAVLGDDVGELKSEITLNTNDVKSMIGEVETTTTPVAIYGSAIHAGVKGAEGSQLTEVTTNNYWYAYYNITPGAKYTFTTNEITSLNYPNCAWILDANGYIIQAFERANYTDTFVAPSNAAQFVILWGDKYSYGGQLESVSYSSVMENLHDIQPTWLDGAEETGNLLHNATTVLSDVRWIKPTGSTTIGTQALAGYKSILMPVKQNTDYAFTYARYLYYVGSDGETLLNDGAATEKVRTCNSGSAYYLAICFDNNTYPFSSYVFCEGTTIAGKSNVMVTLPWLDIAEQAETIGLFNDDVLHGKKWAVCGDSFTNGATNTKMPAGTKYAGENYTYPYIIASRHNMTLYKFFEGGRTLAFPAEPDDFVNSLTYTSGTYYYQNIPADTDYITIYLGINDAHHAGYGSDDEEETGVIPIGTISDGTTATYLGAWNVVLSWLIANRPNAHIGIIVTNGIASHDEYRQGQIAIAEKYGIPYIDMNGDARTPAMLRTSNPNIAAAVKAALIQKWAVNPGTNEHPNDAAQLFESSFIEAFLRSI